MPRGDTTWFLTATERGNPATRIDAATEAGREPRAWSHGNHAQPLIHGAAYFRVLHDAIEAAGVGDLILFTDWQGNPDERLTGEPGSEVVEVLGRALQRGADVRGLVWRSHSGLLGYAAEEHQELGRLLQERGADIQLDMRVRRGGAHHQKFVVVRYAGEPARDVAFVGGIDLCHGRRDDARHLGDPQAEPLAEEYGERPPWHDVQLQLRGPVVHTVETVFRERWEDSTPPTRSPLRRLRDRTHDLDDERRPLPAQAPPPPPVAGHDHAVQLLRTYPRLGPGWSYDFAPDGERSVARGYTKALRRARSLVYLEDQFLWGEQMSEVLADALAEHTDLRFVAVLPLFPDQDGWFRRDPQLLGRMRALRRLVATAPDRVAVYGLENHAGTPIYVHAKVCVLDDAWTTVGSDNFCRRSWTNDSELSAAVVDLGEGSYARWLRLTLAAEHLDRLDGPDLPRDADLDDLMSDCLAGPDLFDRFAEHAAALDAWHADGRTGPRPPGRLRRITPPSLSPLRAAVASPSYQLLHDPDGRPLRLRLRRRF